MTLAAERIDPPVADPVSNVLKWVLLVVAVLTFALLAWATTATYRLAPPQPDRFVGADGAVLMTDADIVAGKGGFQAGVRSAHAGPAGSRDRGHAARSAEH